MNAYAKPEFTASIVQIKAGTSLPETLLTKLVSENKSAFGLIVKETNKLEIEKFPKLDGIEASIEQMKVIEENTKKKSRMYFFMEVQSPEFDEDEVMPLILLKDSKNNPLLSVCVEGDFPQYANNDEGYSEAFCLVDQWLGPKIEQMYGMLGNNPVKIIDYLKTAQFANDFQAALGGGHRGVLAFIPAQGDMFVIEKNDIGLSSDSGFYVSNAYGYTESAAAAATPATAETPAPTKPKSKYATAPVTPQAPKPTVQPPAAVPTPPATPEEKVAQEIIEGVDVEEEVDWTPPLNVHGKNLKTLYQSTAGFLPKDWKQRPTLRIKVKRKVTSPAEIAATRAGMAANGSTVTPVKDMKGDAPKPIPTVLPVLSAQQQAKVIEHLQKILGDGSGVIADPIDAQKIENDMAMFSKVVLKSGNIEEVRRLPHSYFFAMAKEDPEALALMAIELRSVARKFWDLLRDPSKLNGYLNVGGSSTKTGTEPVKPTQSPSPEQVEVPATPAPASPAPSPAEQPVVRKRSRYAS